MINVGCSVNINDLYNNTEKTKKFWLKWKKKKRFMSPLDVRLKYCSLLISTLIRPFKVAELRQTLKFSSLQTQWHKQIQHETKKSWEKQMKRADDLNMNNKCFKNM